MACSRVSRSSSEKLEAGGCQVLLQVVDPRRAGDGEHHRRAVEEPGEGDLGGRCAVALGDLAEGVVVRQVAGGEREPRDEGDVLLGAVVDHLVPMPVAQVVLVLHRGDRQVLAGAADLLDARLREPDEADLALVEELLEDSHLVLEGHVRVDPVELVEIDALELEAAQAPLAGFPQVLRPAVGLPLARPGADQAALGGDHQPLRVRMEGLGDELLGDLRAVGVGGVDEVDAQLDGAAQHAPRLLLVVRRPPDAFAGQPHRAEAHAVDLQVAAQLECSGRGRVGSQSDCHGASSGCRMSGLGSGVTAPGVTEEVKQIAGRSRLAGVPEALSGA